MRRFRLMLSLRKITWLTAFALLVLCGADLVADFAFGSCDGSASQSSASTGDECFCCCGHYIVPAPPAIPVAEAIEIGEQVISATAISAQLPSVYHPPRF